MKALVSAMSLAFVAMLACTGSAFAQHRERISGDGNVKKETRDVTGFSGLSVGGSAHVFLVQGSTESVQIEADANLLPYIVSEKESGNLSIHFKRGYDLKSNNPINVYVTAKDIDYMGISGGVVLDASKGITTKELKLEASGSLRMDLKLQATTLNASFSGSVDVKINGTASNAAYSISGSADISAPGLQTNSAEVNVSGSGKLDLAVAKELDVSISGSGSIHYKGSPEIKKHISGSGKIYND